MHRPSRCLWTGGSLAAILGLLAMPMAKAGVDDTLAGEARTALTNAGIKGVATSSDWATLTLTGPASLRARSLAAVENVPHRDAADAITYTSSDASSATGKSNTGKVAIEVSTAFRGSPERITLSGQIADQSQRRTLVDAAAKAVGKDNVIDTLLVDEGSAGFDANAAVTGLAGVIERLGTLGAVGNLELSDTKLVADVKVPAASLAAARSALDAAKKAGLQVTGQVSAIAASSPAATTAPSGSATGSSGSSSAAPSPTGSGTGSSDSGSGSSGSGTGGSTGDSGTANDAAAVQSRLTSLLSAPGITFSTGSAALTAADRSLLDRAAAVLIANPKLRVEVAGHTDNQGDPAANKALSQSRAEAVRAYLISKGVAAQQLTAVGYGATRPVADNTTDAGRTANRRIELDVQNFIGS